MVRASIDRYLSQYMARRRWCTFSLSAFLKMALELIWSAGFILRVLSARSIPQCLCERERVLRTPDFLRMTGLLLDERRSVCRWCTMQKNPAIYREISKFMRKWPLLRCSGSRIGLIIASSGSIFVQQTAWISCCSHLAKYRAHPGSSTFSLVFKCSPSTILNALRHPVTA
jgi:hypothetical protein